MKDVLVTLESLFISKKKKKKKKLPIFDTLAHVEMNTLEERQTETVNLKPCSGSETSLRIKWPKSFCSFADIM